jgi:hypothetical protein
MLYYPCLTKEAVAFGALITISIVVTLTVEDSEFIKLFYGTDLDTPGSFHLSLFLTFI